MSIWNTIKSFFGYDNDPTTDDTYGYQIELIDGGYRVLRADGSVMVDQPFVKGVSGKIPYETPEAAQADAEADIRAAIDRLRAYTEN